MINKEHEIQKILKKKFMEGPKFLMAEDSTGINYFSGNSSSAYYELYGSSSIFRLLIIEPSNNLFTSSYVGKNHLLFLLIEEDQVKGGFASINEEPLLEFQRVYPHLTEDQIKELVDLWLKFAKKHYDLLIK
ncbi:hypothetical protein FZC74_16690 [Sutcliffiella horikoshii]|uniref:Uncharacterized protein n=1 Tax=Sutcliffiella horikoshii TaxID=79883 RepID=A0AA94WNK3_9BACI|nr:hypothetical protein [Sutcliffiella horikoshii]TYS57328.1 hypothetical protein FZC74_16690 [Sutcliffiella horikoshii]